MEAVIYNQKGKEAGKIELPKEIFGLPWNADLVHQVVVSMRSNERVAIADTKDRAEVRGGGKKPWQQKGTGRARHGSSRSPIWSGGGVTHGPTSEKNFKKSINKKMKTKALFTLLSAKLRDGEIFFIDKLALSGKTKEGGALLTAMSKVEKFEKANYEKGKRVLLAPTILSAEIERSFENLKTVKAEELRNINPLTLATYKYLVLADPEESLKVIAARA